MTEDEQAQMQAEEECELWERESMAGLAECHVGLRIWRDHKFVKFVCEHCGMRLQ